MILYGEHELIIPQHAMAKTTRARVGLHEALINTTFRIFELQSIDTVTNSLRSALMKADSIKLGDALDEIGNIIVNLKRES